MQRQPDEACLLPLCPVQIINDAEWDQLSMMQSRVLSQPNNMRQSLDNCIALIDDSKQQEQAGKVAAELFEFVDR